MASVNKLLTGVSCTCLQTMFEIVYGIHDDAGIPLEKFLDVQLINSLLTVDVDLFLECIP